MFLMEITMVIIKCLHYPVIKLLKTVKTDVLKGMSRNRNYFRSSTCFQVLAL